MATRPTHATLERVGMELVDIVASLRFAHRLTNLQQRREALDEINRQTWEPTYETVKSKLCIPDTLSISAWVIAGDGK